MTQENHNEFQILIKAFNYLRTHWWLFLLEILTVVGVYFGKYYTTPNVYESVASILVGRSHTEAYLASINKEDSDPKAEQRRENLASLLKSDSVMVRFRKKLTDHYNAERRPSHLRVLFPNGTAYSPSYFGEYINLKWSKFNDIFDIRCTASNPDAAHDICLIYLNTIEAIYPEIVQRRLLLKQEFLNRQIATLSSQIAEKEIELANLEQEDEDFYDFIVLAGQNNEHLQSLRNEIIRVKQLIATNEALKSMLNSVPHSNGDTHTALQATITAINSRINEVTYKRHLTKQVDSPDRERRLKSIDSELGLLKSQLAELTKRSNELFLESPVTMEKVRERLANLVMERKMNDLTLAELQKKITEVKEQQRKFRRKQLEYNRRKAEIHHTSVLLTTLYEQEQHNELSLSVGSSEIYRIKTPTRNYLRIEPALSKYLFAGISISLFVCLLTSVLLATLCPRIDSELEVHQLNLPVLGKVPVCKATLHGIENLPALALEYLKIMNYRILRETKELKCPIVIVTSPQPGEGKSTVTYFLNLASASPGRKSLFIDGDLITSHPNAFFGIEEDASPGLKSVIENPDKPIDIKSLVVDTTFEGVSFLPRGGKVQTIASPRFLNPISNLFEALRKEYDMIFVDTPPLFTSNLSHQWAGQGDLIVLVARIYFTRPKDLTEALQTCKIFSKVPVGIALNCLPMSGQQRRRGSYYYFSRRRPFKAAA